MIFELTTEFFVSACICVDRISVRCFQLPQHYRGSSAFGLILSLSWPLFGPFKLP
jgi:hypothetical protein